MQTMESREDGIIVVLPVDTGIRSCCTGTEPEAPVCDCRGLPVRKNCGEATWGCPNSCDGLAKDDIAPKTEKRHNPLGECRI